MQFLASSLRVLLRRSALDGPRGRAFGALVELVGVAEHLPVVEGRPAIHRDTRRVAKSGPDHVQGKVVSPASAIVSHGTVGHNHVFLAQLQGGIRLHREVDHRALALGIDDEIFDDTQLMIVRTPDVKADQLAAAYDSALWLRLNLAGRGSAAASPPWQDWKQQALAERLRLEPVAADWPG